MTSNNNRQLNYIKVDFLPKQTPKTTSSANNLIEPIYLSIYFSGKQTNKKKTVTLLYQQNQSIKKLDNKLFDALMRSKTTTSNNKKVHKYIYGEKIY